MTRMNQYWIHALVSGGLMLAATASLIWWFHQTGDVSITARQPLPSEKPANRRADVDADEPVDIEGTFQKFDDLPPAVPGSWPRFRGTDTRNISSEPVALADHWPQHGPPQLWSVALGEGHAGAAVHKGRVYLLDYDEENNADTLRCFSLTDGGEIWRRAYEVHVKRNHGMSRTVPAVTDDIVVTIGPKCHVMCVDATSGAFLWGLDLVARFDCTVPLWYTGQCPLIDSGQVILAPGGTALMVGVDCKTGRILWETPNPDAWQMSHASVMPITLQGHSMFVYPAIGGTFGVSAEGPDRGTLLWSTRAWNGSVICPSAVGIDASRVFLSGGYGMGSMMLGIEKTAAGFQATPLFSLDKTLFGSEQQTPILFGDHLYGVLPKDAAARRAQLVCLDLSGTQIWTSGKTERFGLGPYLIADDKLFVLNDNGELSLVRATPKAYQLLSRAKVLQGRDAWAPMAIADGYLLLRDSRTLVCLDVRSEATPLGSP